MQSQLLISPSHDIDSEEHDPRSLINHADALLTMERKELSISTPSHERLDEFVFRHNHQSDRTNIVHPPPYVHHYHINHTTTPNHNPGLNVSIPSHGYYNRTKYYLQNRSIPRYRATSYCIQSMLPFDQYMYIHVGI
jgi:hypothetical protein